MAIQTAVLTVPDGTGGITQTIGIPRGSTLYSASISSEPDQNAAHGKVYVEARVSNVDGGEGFKLFEGALQRSASGDHIITWHGQFPADTLLGSQVRFKASNRSGSTVRLSVRVNAV